MNATLGRLPRPDHDLRVGVDSALVDPVAEQVPDARAIRTHAAGPLTPGVEAARLFLECDLLDLETGALDERAPLLLGEAAHVSRVVQPLGLFDQLAVVEGVLDEHDPPRDAGHLHDCAANVRA